MAIIGYLIQELNSGMTSKFFFCSPDGITQPHVRQPARHTIWRAEKELGYTRIQLLKQVAGGCQNVIAVSKLYSRDKVKKKFFYYIVGNWNMCECSENEMCTPHL